MGNGLEFKTGVALRDPLKGSIRVLGYRPLEFEVQSLGLRSRRSVAFTKGRADLSSRL